MCRAGRAHCAHRTGKLEPEDEKTQRPRQKEAVGPADPCQGSCMRGKDTRQKAQGSTGKESSEEMRW